MKNLLIKQLRERSIVKGKMRPWIADLADEEIWQVYMKLRNGESSRSVAQFVKERWKVKSSSDIHSISQTILKFKRKIMDLLDLELTDSQNEKEGKQEEALSEPEWHDSLVRLERIALLVAERAERLLIDEQNGIRHPNISKDLQALAQLQKQLLREKQFVIDHPDDVLEKRREQVKDKKRQAQWGQFVDGLGDGGQRLIGVIDDFLERVTKEVVPVVYNPETGTYEPVEQEKDVVDATNSPD